MSGHSKWAQIKRQKGINDTKRGAQFTKLSNAISLAVRQGGAVGDPNQNFRLRLAIDAAKQANMPKDNIERAIQRASGKQDVAMEETVYEGFGPGGIAIIVEAATDNKNRTTSEVQNIFNKHGGTMGQMGSVAYLFHQRGQIIITKNNTSFDEIFEKALESGAEDIEESGDEVIIYTAPADLAKVRNALSTAGFMITLTELIRKPLTPLFFSDPTAIDKITAFFEKLEELDDVQKTYSNFEIQ